MSDEAQISAYGASPIVGPEPADGRDVKAIRRQLSDLCDNTRARWGAIDARITAEKAERQALDRELRSTLRVIRDDQAIMLGHLKKLVEVPGPTRASLPDAGMVARVAGLLRVEPRTLHLALAAITIAVMSSAITACSVAAITQGNHP